MGLALSRPTHHESQLTKLPAEIFSQIARLACIDGGRTGCSLALVSHFIAESSSLYRYHTVYLRSEEGALCFLKHLQSNPSEHSRFQHLFISFYDCFRVQALSTISASSPRFVQSCVNLLNLLSSELVALSIIDREASLMSLKPMLCLPYTSLVALITSTSMQLLPSDSKFKCPL